jgi:hypothetical protein
MKNRTRAWRIALAVTAGCGCLFISDDWSALRQGNLTTAANAVIGRPATPGSVAGVARRTTRRTVRRHTYGGAYHPAPYTNGYYRNY